MVARIDTGCDHWALHAHICTYLCPSTRGTTDDKGPPASIRALFDSEAEQGELGTSESWNGQWQLASCVVCPRHQSIREATLALLSDSACVSFDLQGKSQLHHRLTILPFDILFTSNNVSPLCLAENSISHLLPSHSICWPLRFSPPLQL